MFMEMEGRELKSQNTLVSNPRVDRAPLTIPAKN